MGSVNQANQQRETISSGIRWAGVGQGVRILFQTIVSIVLARLLMPEDFGLLAMAQAITGFIVVFQFMGTSGPIVQRKDLPPSLIDTVFWLNVAFGVIFSIGVAGTASWLAEVYASDEVTPIIRAMAISMFVSSFGGVPGALIRRRMRFDQLAKVGIISGLTTGIVALVLAYLDYGVWALVVSTIVGAGLDSILMLFFSGWRPRFRFSLTDLKTVINFCLNMTASNVVLYFTGSSDKVIMGRWLGSASLGLYSMAYKFTVHPLNHMVFPVLGRVIFPAYSSMQSDEELLRKTMTRALGGIVFITFPLMAGMATVADPFVHAVLGEKWVTTIGLFYLMAPLAAMKSMLWAATSVFLARDKSGLYFWVQVIYAAAMVSAYLIGVQFGLRGVLVAALIAQVLLVLFELYLSGREIKLGLFTQLAVVRGPLIASVIMGAAVWGSIELVRSALSVPELVVLFIGIGTGIVVYLATVLLFRLQALMDLVGLLPEKYRPVMRRLLRIR